MNDPSSPAKYHKRPLLVEAMQWTGGNFQQINDWANDPFTTFKVTTTGADDGLARLWVAANQVWVSLDLGEWILKDENGFYPCKASTFQKTYELAQSGEQLAQQGDG